MKLGMVGLGRMGSNMVRRLLGAGHECVVFDIHPPAALELAKAGATATRSLAELAAKLEAPRAIWILVPAAVVDSTIGELAPLLAAADTDIDGGTSYDQDDIRRAKTLGERGIHYVDAGTLGGVRGFERGYCQMIGGEPATVKRLDGIFAALAPSVDDATTVRQDGNGTAQRGSIHCGPAELHQDDLKLPDIVEVWRRGSVIGSWLLDLTAAALKKSPDLETFAGRVSDSGEGRWTLKAAIDEGVPAPVLSTALAQRFASRGEEDFANNVLSALRDEFGGHAARRVRRTRCETSSADTKRSTDGAASSDALIVFGTPRRSP